ncbi:MAG: GGDEF domain-containing response regulator [Gammaproteobacteria bacterium]
MSTATPLSSVLKVILVDASTDNRERYKQYLLEDRAIAYRILESTNLDEALSIYEQAQPDCIIMNDALPDIEILKFLGKLNNQQVENHVALVMLSNKKDNDLPMDARLYAATDCLEKNKLSSELLNRTVMNAVMRARLIAQLEKQNQVLSFVANHDALTCVLNRKAFDENLEKSINSARRHQRMMALLFIDLDDFKQVNDQHGHHIGDALLKQVVMRLNKVLRIEDTIARLGGDEFAIILNEIESPHDAGIVASKIIDAIKMDFHVDGHELQIGVSIGIACYPVAAEDKKTLVQCADIAMYRAKEMGKRNFQFFSAEVQRETQQRFEMEKQLRVALDNRELTMDYQPFYALADGKMIGIEALLRWNSAEFGLVSPLKIIALAQESGLFDALNNMIFNTVQTDHQTLFAKTYSHYSLSLNVNVKQLENTAFCQRLDELAQQHVLPPHLILEFPEADIANQLHQSRQLQRLTQLFEKLQNLNCQIAISQFGTSAFSLHALRQLPIDYLKLAPDFLQELVLDAERGQAFLTALLQLATCCGIKVIAEGIENQAQVDFIRACHCEFGQGYYWAAPMSASDLINFYKP